MKTTLHMLIALSTILLATGTVSAQPRTDDEPWGPVKHLTFTEDDIEGGTLGPEGEQITSVPRSEHASLIEIREGFEAEMLKSLEDM
jgi:hypothetical protein